MAKSSIELELVLGGSIVGFPQVAYSGSPDTIICSAIVNAATPFLDGRGIVNGQITVAGGMELERMRRAILPPEKFVEAGKFAIHQGPIAEIKTNFLIDAIGVSFEGVLDPLPGFDVVQQLLETILGRLEHLNVTHLALVLSFLQPYAGSQVDFESAKIQLKALVSWCHSLNRHGTTLKKVYVYPQTSREAADIPYICDIIQMEKCIARMRSNRMHHRLPWSKTVAAMSGDPSMHPFQFAPPASRATQIRDEGCTIMEDVASVNRYMPMEKIREAIGYRTKEAVDAEPGASTLFQKLAALIEGDIKNHPYHSKFQRRLHSVHLSDPFIQGGFPLEMRMHTLRSHIKLLLFQEAE
jgi:hypothetical protein